MRKIRKDKPKLINIIKLTKYLKENVRQKNITINGQRK
jgi:hypothetical protein